MSGEGSASSRPSSWRSPGTSSGESNPVSNEARRQGLALNLSNAASGESRSRIGVCPQLRYLSYRENDGKPSITFWNLLALRLAFVIVFEHVLIVTGWIIDMLVPDIPESVENKVKRERYLAKQALAEHQHSMALVVENDAENAESGKAVAQPSRATSL